MRDFPTQSVRARVESESEMETCRRTNRSYLELRKLIERTKREDRSRAVRLSLELSVHNVDDGR